MNLTQKLDQLQDDITDLMDCPRVEQREKIMKMLEVDYRNGIYYVLGYKVNNNYLEDQVRALDNDGYDWYGSEIERLCFSHWNTGLEIIEALENQELR